MIYIMKGVHCASIKCFYRSVREALITSDSNFEEKSEVFFSKMSALKFRHPGKLIPFTFEEP